MLVQFSALTGQPPDAAEAARLAELLEGDGVTALAGPTGVCLKGDWDRVMAAVRRCHEALAREHGRIVTTIVIDDRRAGADGGARHRQVTRTDLDVEC
jgi:uncharacterized protein YqgV (UPF0045/DUF77 family)